MPAQPVITRFAPSPTGHLHVGGARTALFCWALAKANHGRMVLRIEDTDRKRSSEDAAKGILEDLAWLGIHWDDGPAFTDEHDQTHGGDDRTVGPFHQSERTNIYDAHFKALIEAGHAYPAFDTPEELGAMRAEAEKAKRSFIYRRPPDVDADAALARMNAGETHVLRLKAPDEAITVHDAVLGDVTIQPEELDDFVIRKADGFPTYHFAVVIDDHLMGVTHILRGQEHLANTPRHVALQRALGLATPLYAHMPLIFNPDGSKMSKRDKDKFVRTAAKDSKLDATPIDAITPDAFAFWMKDKRAQLPTDQLRALAAHLELSPPEIDVDDFRRSGYLPDVLCNYLALLGWNPGMKNEDGTDLERFDSAFLCERFTLDRLGKSNSKFDRAKLLAFNADTIQKDLTDASFAELWRDWCARYDPSILERLGDRFDHAAAMARPRTKTLSDAADAIRFALIADDAVVFDDKAVAKSLRKGDPNGLSMLPELRALVEGLDPFEPEAIESGAKAFCEARELGMGKVAQPLRVAITGTSVSPGLGDTLALVGKASVLARIDRCMGECAPEPNNPPSLP